MYSMKKLSDRRLAILSFIQGQVAVKGQPPTLAEIADACGLASRGAARKHVLALEADGLIENVPGQARGARPKGPKARAVLLANALFEVSPRDIAELDDSDLRELIARLCIARLSAKGHAPQYVTWGGDQRAADGGIDVRIDAPQAVAAEAGFPRRLIGFQVKAMKMPRSEIQNEMCPNGVLRPSIRAIIQSKGAYIIASSQSTTDVSYQDRKAAMREAASSEMGASEAEFDFYDSRRIADLTNDQPGVVAWVRTRLGRPLQGWRPYEQWAVSHSGGGHSFINDTKPRLRDPADPNSDTGYPLAEGLQEVRSLLRQGGTSVRIAGLSGVGKTRFAQALFEAASAENPLDPVLAVYTDISAGPSPTPQALLDELLTNKRRAVLIVDNCSSELHGQLTAKCKTSNCVSLLTIEYDIRDDIPDETNVFRLEPASPDLITKVIEQQFPNISRVDASTITSFAEGNSRVAIALANTLGKRDSLAGISNDDLFRRLFWQKNDENESLLRAAQACALVYSFEENESTELPRIAALAGMGVLELYRELNTLLKRGLAQKRGVWRAVLPHAIANMLAKQALSATPYSFIATQLVDGRGRLLRSFSRRLGYLHDNAEAEAITCDWLSESGLLGNVAELDELLSEVLRNVAPVNPEAALQAVERATTSNHADQFLSVKNYSRRTITHLLRSIAWEAKFFERCMSVLLKFAMAEPPHYNTDNTTSIIKSMFPIYLSGTHASDEQRVAWIRAGLNSDNEQMQSLAAECLDSALESHHFTSHYGFDFGARSRDYGYMPKRGLETRAWYELFVRLAIDLGSQRTPVGERLRGVLAANFRSLWSVVGLYDLLEEATIKLTPYGWEKGWLAIRMTLGLDKKGMPEEAVRRLVELEKSVHPSTLIEKTRAIVLTSYSSGLDITDGDGEDVGVHSYERAELFATELGRKVAVDQESFETLLPNLVENKQGRHWRFGFGLAQGAVEPAKIWHALVSAFESADSKSRSIQVLNGFLGGLFERDRLTFEQLLDDAMDNTALAEWLPVLQTTVKLDSRGYDRLIRSLARGDASAEMYQYLAYGKVASELSDDEIAHLLREIAHKNEGLLVALDILSMNLYGNEEAVGPAVLLLARELLSSIPLTRNHNRLDFSLKSIIERCMVGPEAEDSARSLLKSIRNGLDGYSIYAYDFDDAIEALFATQPVASLDELVSDDSDEGVNYIRRRDFDSDYGKNALARVPIETLLSWCGGGSSERWPNIAASIPAFITDVNGDEPMSWSQQALSLIKNAPNPVKVVDVLVDRIAPSSWSGSRAEIMTSRLPLFDQLASLLSGEGLEKLAECKEIFQRMIARERKRESEDDRSRNERFE